MAKAKTFHEALKADEGYQDALACTVKYAHDINEIEDELRTKFTQIQALMRAVDLVTGQYIGNVSDEDDDKVLLKVTGQCSECWDTDWSFTQKSLFEAIAGVCSEAAELNDQRQGREELRRIAVSTLHKTTDKVRRDFYKQEES